MVKSLWFAAGIVFLASTQSWSAAKNEKLEKLATSIQQVLDQKHEPKSAQPGAYPDAGRMLLLQLRSAISRNDAMQIESALQGISGLIDSEPLRKECEEISSQMGIERDAREKKTEEEINGSLKRAAGAVRSAAKPADLDAVLHELGQLGGRRNEQESSRSVSNALNKVQPTLQFVTHWQDYLASTVTGNIQAAREALNNLASGYNANQPDLIPRSEILARMQSLKAPQREQRRNSEEDEPEKKQPDHLTVEKPLVFEKTSQTIAFDIKKLEELDGVVKAFEKLQSKPEFRSYQSSINKTLETMAPLNRAYKELKAGLATNIQIPSRNLESSLLENEIVSLRAELILLALPRYLELPPKTMPKPGEGPYDFLSRITAEAISRNDYLLAARAHETQRMLREGTAPSPEEKSQAALFMTAHNQEAAKQFALAVASYEKALACGTNLVPPKAIGERLEAIKAEHPQEFQQGYDLFLMPPVPRYGPSGYPPGFPNPGMGWQPGMQGRMQGQQPPPQTPVISVPAAPAAPNKK